MISIIIPTYNEEDTIESTITHIKQSSRNEPLEIIISDCNSSDNTVVIARALECTVINAKQGRGQQMNAGAKLASGDILLFLHADTVLPDNFIQLINKYMANNNTPLVWGRFDVKLSGDHFLFRIIEKMMSLRSKLTGIATGDQAIFVKRESFLNINGFKNIPLMEDVEFTKRLKKLSSPVCLEQHVVTSSRRWENNGIVKTVILMWTLRLLYFFGVSPVVLKQYY